MAIILYLLHSSQTYTFILFIQMKNPNSSRTIDLPIVIPNNHDEYNHSKHDRVNLQRKRKQLEGTVSYLKRHAHENNKQYHQTQLDLWKLYKKKAQNYEEKSQKLQNHKLNQQKLQQKRNQSSLTRYLHTIKKEEALKQLKSKKKSIVEVIKKNHRQKQELKKINDSRICELQKEKNRSLNETVKNGTMYAMTKVLNDRKKASKSVRNEMISIEQQMKNRQLERILDLERKKAELSQIVKKTRKNKDKLENIKGEVDVMDPKDIYNIVQPIKEKSRERASVESLNRSFRKSKSSRKHYQSNSFIK